ncbi:immunoglobulin-like domain-containing receptor 2 [Arapaima gigas]
MSVRAERLLLVVCLAVTGGAALHVTVGERQRYAMLFQQVELHCQFSSSSSQLPVVQWWYKSYCGDPTHSSFSLPGPPPPLGPKLESNTHLDCTDSGRTVRPVASGQGTAMTLGEHYRGRDIAIVNRSDLHIGQLQWGDSGLYFCKVFISDDLEGLNEAQVELLVLGRRSAANDFLPDINVELMAEWLFVVVVTGGSVAMLLLVALCWCQCCPHSCCCYIRCCCCPDTCCCPRHLYEAGKAPKTPHGSLYPHYYVPSVPTAVSTAPSSVVIPPMPAVPPIESSVRGALSVSQLSSLHDAEPDLQCSHHPAQRTAPPPPGDPQDALDRSSTPPPQGYRWKLHSEHLDRRPMGTCGRARSLDELEDFADSYERRSRWAEFRGVEDSYGLELQERPLGTALRPRGDRDEYQADRHRKASVWGRSHTPPPSPHTGGCNYDDTLLSSLLEEKARGHRGASDRDTPPKARDCYYSRSLSNRTADDDSLPPYTERSPSCPRPPRWASLTLQERPRKAHNTLLSRDALVV